MNLALSTSRSVAIVGSVAVAGCLALAVGCTLGLDLGREQCASQEDCADLGYPEASCIENLCQVLTASTASTASTAVSSSSAMSSSSTGLTEPGWECLGSFVQPEPPAGEKIRHTHRFELAISPGTPPAGLEVKLCQKFDVQCASPLSMHTPDAKGTLVLDLDPAFDGFLWATTMDTLPGFVFLQKPVVLPPKEKVIRMVSLATAKSLAGAVQKTIDETRGIALILTSNCADERSSGVSMDSQDVDAASVKFYFRGMLPDLEVNDTDAQGAAGYLNLPIGVVKVEARHAASGLLIGTGSMTTYPSAISYLPLGPTEE